LAKSTISSFGIAAQSADHVVDGGVDVGAVLELARAVMSAAFERLHEKELFDLRSGLEMLVGFQKFVVGLDQLLRRDGVQVHIQSIITKIPRL
jgi:hypothetical protein